jgi:hypothetical protein
MSAAGETLQIEAFQTNLHGAKILCQGPFPTDRQPPILESITDRRQPFQKKVLLSLTPFSFSKSLTLSYDATFHVASAMDWSLALTYITHAPKPLLVVADDIPVPDAVWSRIPRTVTFVHLLTTPVRSPKLYDAVFFAAIQDSTSPYSEQTYRVLQSLIGSLGTKEYREIVNELRVATAGIAWSKIDESTEAGALYWYDPVKQQGAETLSKKQLADLFSWLAAYFGS